MSEYAMTVFAICLLGGGLLMISYGREMGEGLAIGMISLSVILTPIAGVIKNAEPEDVINSLRGEYTDVENTADGVIEDAFAHGIALAVAEKFSVDADCVRVRTVNFDAANMRAEKIVIVLSRSAIAADYKAVESYINSLDLGVCNVQVEIG